MYRMIMLGSAPGVFAAGDLRPETCHPQVPRAIAQSTLAVAWSTPLVVGSLTVVEGSKGLIQGSTAPAKGSRVVAEESTAPVEHSFVLVWSFIAIVVEATRTVECVTGIVQGSGIGEW